ncbi:hypothetical protein [Aulosira sp. FACHB-615]|nr:hypothetical protein [Aulosira sp. FACHB-615]
MKIGHWEISAIALIHQFTPNAIASATSPQSLKKPPMGVDF